MKLLGRGSFSFCVAAQAQTVWQWFNYLAATVPTGKRALRLNLDETAICMHEESPKGNVCVDRKRARSIHQHVPRAKRRRYLTYVAIICDNAAVQRTLPQFLIGNSSLLKQREMPELLSNLGPNVRLLRRKSSWVNQRTMLEILRELHAAIVPLLCELQPILLFDAAPQHTQASVFRMARRLQIWPLPIPAGCTYLLQPLDTHAFLSFKRCLEQKNQEAQVEAGRSDVNLQRFLACVCAAIQEIISNQSWEHAFQGDGFCVAQVGLSDRVRAELAIEGSATCNAERPALEDVACCFPKRFRVTAEIAFGVTGQIAIGRPLLLRARLLESRSARITRSAPIEWQRTETPAVRSRMRCVLFCTIDAPLCQRSFREEAGVSQ